MPQQFSANVLQTLADHLGVPAREILLTHDLYRDWGLTPLALVVVLLDLERVADIELPSQELGSVRTVADLVLKFRTWVRQSDTVGHPLVWAPLDDLRLDDNVVFVGRVELDDQRRHHAAFAASCITYVGSSAATAPPPRSTTNKPATRRAPCAARLAAEQSSPGILLVVTRHAAPVPAFGVASRLDAFPARKYVGGRTHPLVCGCFTNSKGHKSSDMGARTRRRSNLPVDAT